jgi:hypothetical protein
MIIIVNIFEFLIAFETPNDFLIPKIVSSLFMLYKYEEFEITEM